MFGKKNLEVNHFTNLIAKGTHVIGSVEFSGVLAVEGSISGGKVVSAEAVADTKGNVCLVINSGGVIVADEVASSNVVVSGNLTSKVLKVESSLKITQTASIKDAVIYYRELLVEPGAQLINCQLKHLDFCSEGEIV